MAVDVINFERYTVHPVDEEGRYVSFEGVESVYGTASYGYVRQLLKQQQIEIPEVDRYQEPEAPTFDIVDSPLLAKAAEIALVQLSESANPIVDGDYLFDDRQEDFSPTGETRIERLHRQTVDLLTAIKEWSERGLYTVVLS